MASTPVPPCALHRFSASAESHTRSWSVSTKADTNDVPTVCETLLTIAPERRSRMRAYDFPLKVAFHWP
eukprot:966051-Prymnesium_polylepis.1